MIAKRKYYPGNLRKAGEKEYAILLSKLISYSKQLEKDIAVPELISISKKIMEKLIELGFKRESNKVNVILKSTTSIEKNKLKIVNIALNAWDTGTEKHKNARKKKKEKKTLQ